MRAHCALRAHTALLHAAPDGRWASFFFSFSDGGCASAWSRSRTFHPDCRQNGSTALQGLFAGFKEGGQGIMARSPMQAHFPCDG